MGEASRREPECSTQQGPPEWSTDSGLCFLCRFRSRLGFKFRVTCTCNWCSLSLSSSFSCACVSACGMRTWSKQPQQAQDQRCRLRHEISLTEGCFRTRHVSEINPRSGQVHVLRGRGEGGVLATLRTLEMRTTTSSTPWAVKQSRQLCPSLVLINKVG